MSQELGGTDEDVKKYFFSLTGAELDEVLVAYGEAHGPLAKEYAEITLPQWRAGHVKMSGLVAERLFALLPDRMPMDVKLSMVESLWRHVEPSHKQTLYVNPLTPQPEVEAAVLRALTERVTERAIPESLEKRFNWLAQGDSKVKQSLLNHFRSMEKGLAAESLRINLPIISGHLKSPSAALTGGLSHSVAVGKTEITVRFSSEVQGVTEVEPPRRQTGGETGCLFIMAFPILAFLLLK
ncbi:MAG: hypothetical protein AB7E72_05895 [Lysobacterales bacterium]